MYYLEQETQNLKKKNMSYIEKNKVDLYAVLDHYTNIKKRFIYKRKIIKPKKNNNFR